jgi:hypothetical protein
MRLSLAGLAVLTLLAAPAAMAQPAAPNAAAPNAAGPSAAAPAAPAVAVPEGGATGAASVVDAKQFGGKQADVKQVAQCCEMVRTFIALEKGWAPPAFAEPLQRDACTVCCSPCYDGKGDVKQVGKFSK